MNVKSIAEIPNHFHSTTEEPIYKIFVKANTNNWMNPYAFLWESN